MVKQESDPVIKRVLTEQHQSADTRKHLFIALESELKRPVVSFFTSFRFPVMIENQDADMLEGVLQKINLSKGLALILNSPGGDGLAAERIIKVCRSYSKTGEYWAIVPSKAKSAATIICFGASRILMGNTSELGPIDPQLAIPDGKNLKRFSVYNIIMSYNHLFRRAVSEKGNLQPYLQQLANYDEREIAEFQRALDLSEDIAIKALASGMMKGKSRDSIHKKIEVFLTPEETKTHGRAIYIEEAKKCGLKIQKKDVKGKFWSSVYELYIRTNNFVSSKASKCVESVEHSFYTSTGE